MTEFLAYFYSVTVMFGKISFADNYYQNSIAAEPKIVHFFIKAWNFLHK